MLYCTVKNICSEKLGFGKFGELQQFAKFCRQISQNFITFPMQMDFNSHKFFAKLPTVLSHQTFSLPNFLLYGKQVYHRHGLPLRFVALRSMALTS